VTSEEGTVTCASQVATDLCFDEPLAYCQPILISSVGCTYSPNNEITDKYFQNVKVDDGTSEVPEFIEAAPFQAGFTASQVLIVPVVVCYEKRACHCVLTGDLGECLPNTIPEQTILVTYAINPQSACTGRWLID
jgi:hypothetical protein